MVYFGMVLINRIRVYLLCFPLLFIIVQAGLIRDEIDEKLKGHEDARKLSDDDQCAHIYDPTEKERKIKIISFKGDERKCCGCPRGTKVGGLCKPEEYNTTICIPCDEGTYIDQIVHARSTCLKDTLTCDHIEHAVYIPSTKKTSPKCVCLDGYFMTTRNVCQLHSKCPPGRGVKLKGNATDDTKCEVCPFGFESHTSSAIDTCKIAQNILKHPRNQHLLAPTEVVAAKEETTEFLTTPSSAPLVISSSRLISSVSHPTKMKEVLECQSNTVLIILLCGLSGVFIFFLIVLLLKKKICVETQNCLNVSYNQATTLTRGGLNAPIGDGCLDQSNSGGSVYTGTDHGQETSVTGNTPSSAKHFLDGGGGSGAGSDDARDKGEAIHETERLIEPSLNQSSPETRSEDSERIVYQKRSKQRLKIPALSSDDESAEAEITQDESILSYPNASAVHMTSPQTFHQQTSLQESTSRLKQPPSSSSLTLSSSSPPNYSTSLSRPASSPPSPDGSLHKNLPCVNEIKKVICDHVNKDEVKKLCRFCWKNEFGDCEAYLKNHEEMEDRRRHEYCSNFLCQDLCEFTRFEGKESVDLLYEVCSKLEKKHGPDRFNAGHIYTFFGEDSTTNKIIINILNEKFPVLNKIDRNLYKLS